MNPERVAVRLTVNGRRYERQVEPRMLLADFLRHELGLTGTHIGCAHGVCGACTVLADGQAVRSCLSFAVQMDGATLTTVEGLAGEGPLTPLQQAFHEHHALQCGFCTPGILIAMTEFLEEVPDPSAEEVRRRLAGNLCRCTGYTNIVAAVLDAARRIRGERVAPPSASESHP